MPDSSRPRIERDGTFKIGASVAGSYKLRITPDGYAPEYYSNKTTLAKLDPSRSALHRSRWATSPSAAAACSPVVS